MPAAPELVVAELVEMLDQVQIAAELQHRMLADRMMRGEKGAKIQSRHEGSPEAVGDCPSQTGLGSMRARGDCSDRLKGQGSALKPARGFAPWTPSKGRGPLQSINWVCFKGRADCDLSRSVLALPLKQTH